MSTETPPSSPAHAGPTTSGAVDAPLSTPGAPERPGPPAAPETPAAPEPKRRSFLYLASALAGGNLIANILRVLGSLFQARLVAPHIQGLFSGLSLIPGYAPFLGLGVLNGLNRELPYYIGKGDRERVNELAAAAQAWSLLVGSVTSLGVLLVAAWYLFRGEMWMAAGLATNAVIVFLLFYSQLYLQTTYRTGHDFARLALVTVIQWSVSLVLVVPIQWLGFYGVCLRALIPAIVSAVLLHRYRPVRVGPKWNTTHWKHLISIGAPIFAVGQLYTWWLLLDGTLVLRLMGTHSLGLYTVTISASLLVSLLPMAVAQVIYPRMAERYGHTERLEDVIRIAVKPIALTVLGVSVMIPTGWFLAGPFVRFVAPMYVGGVPALQWSLLIGIAQAFAPATNVFNVVKRQGLLLTAMFFGVAAYLGTLAFLVRDGMYLPAFPQAMIAGQSVYVAVSYGFLYRLWRRDRASRDGGQQEGSAHN